jgi:hypothetical protein
MGLSVRKISAPTVVMPAAQSSPAAPAPLTAEATPEPNTFNAELARPGPRAGGDPAKLKALAVMREFDGKVAKVKTHPEYKAMSPDDQKKIDESIAIARTRPNPNYYANKLLVLLDTKDAPPAATGAMNAASADASKAEASARLATPAGKAEENKEELATADKTRKWTTLTGEPATYQVDRENRNDVYVKMKVRLSGTKPNVDRVKAMEDDIEKKGSTKGYTLDLEFVDASGPDVFEANVDPNKWVDAGNWSGASDHLAHEAHHLLGLDDRYDYIESHADNADMNMSERLHWFHVQMNKKPDPEGYKSIMAGGPKVLDDDACKVIQAPDAAACQTERKRSTGIK